MASTSTHSRPRGATAASAATPAQPTRTIARMTGMLYLGLAVTGVAGFLMIRPRLISDDAAVTLARIGEQQALARLGVVVELGIVLFQALAALWFYRLFRPTGSFAAGALAGFGLINATVVLGSAACLATAIELATHPTKDTAAQVHLLTSLSGNLWGVGAVFFGLWLIPMGMLVLRSGMPRPLGWLLLSGGTGYVLSAFVSYLAPDSTTVTGMLTLPATLGEFWMIGYLLHGGVFRKQHTRPTQPLAEDTTAPTNG